MTPAFRAFLKRHDNTIATKMLRWVSRESTAGHSRTCPLWPPSSNQGTLPYVLYSLPELLLYPSRRFEEYIHLLYALRLHTPAGHIDRGDLTAAIDQIKNYKGYIDQVGCWYACVGTNVSVFLWSSHLRTLRGPLFCGCLYINLSSLYRWTHSPVSHLWTWKSSIPIRTMWDNIFGKLYGHSAPKHSVLDRVLCVLD